MAAPPEKVEEVLNKHNVNPNILDRDWEDPEKEILATGISQVSNQVCALQNTVEENEEWINKREAVKEYKKEEKLFFVELVGATAAIMGAVFYIVEILA